MRGRVLRLSPDSNVLLVPGNLTARRARSASQLLTFPRDCMPMAPLWPPYFRDNRRVKVSGLIVTSSKPRYALL